MGKASEEEVKVEVRQEDIPNHIAIIMDGNGRWANQRGEPRIFGHRQGVESVRNATECCAELGVRYLTLYAFSTENWNRPKDEVNALMTLLVKTISAEMPRLEKNNIRLMAIGNLDDLPDDCSEELNAAIKHTAAHSGLCLVLALSYSARWDILQAVNALTQEAAQTGVAPLISPEMLKSHLSTSLLPDPELIIRTSGEQRLSNFLLWEAAYAEFYFTETMWPDFSKDDLRRAICNYQQRERRFGKTSEQLSV